ncbi:peroxiredoxin [Shimia isoporae]|uniref:Glutathione-dependent peroxiredoxin n=1 Tax=Shimia isoporae TaxID=647720 RepID=A0A4R1NC77_9RHOB|nr:peroxiredoxin [Shimia isoporae]TCL01243.1 peroxiredoxin [Shimia isoporae]
MTIKSGDTLPSGTLMKLGEAGPEPVALDSLTKGRKIVLFGLPGAFTATCSAAHLPSFMRTADALKAKGIDEVICMSVNDPWVMDAWDKSTGATEAGVTMLSDPDGTLTVAMGLDFSAPPVGFVNRTRRFAAIVTDGVVDLLNEEEERGVCNFTAGETILDAL